LKEIGQVYYYAMEYLPGGTLRTLLEEQPDRRLSLFKTVTIGRQIAAALEHIHNQKVINLDIKPENILFRPQRRRWFSYAISEAVLCDFGAARAIGEPGFGDKIGSLSYLSPEQIKETKAKSDVGYRSDIFLLGIVLYEMTTGKRPFEHPGETIDPQFVPVPPHELIPGVPQKFSRLIMKALAKDVTHRFQSASEMRQALESVPRGIYWSGLPRVTVPFFFTLLLATAVYGIGPQLPAVPLVTTATPTITHTVTMTKTIIPASATAATVMVPATSTTVAMPTVTLAPSRTATFTPRPTATPTMTPDEPATPEF
jgi:serine/threonine protein kinase